MFQRILHKITELQIKVFVGQSIEKTDSKLTEIRNDICSEIAKQAIDIASVVDVFYTRKNEFPKDDREVYCKDSEGYKSIMKYRNNDWIARNGYKISDYDLQIISWSYLPTL